MESGIALSSEIKLWQSLGMIHGYGFQPWPYPISRMLLDPIGNISHGRFSHAMAIILLGTSCDMNGLTRTLIPWPYPTYDFLRLLDHYPEILANANIVAEGRQNL
jgi:hypothetical protein